MVIITDFPLYNHFFYFSTLCYQSDLPFSTPRFLYTIPTPNPLLLEHISLSRPRLSCLTAPLLCWLVVASPCLSLPQHLSCIGWLLNCRLSCCITTSLVALLPLTSCRLSLVTLSLLYCAPPLLLRLSCTSDLTSAPATLVYCWVVVGRVYSVQYKSIFGVPDKVRCNTCEKARPSRLDFQRDKVKIHHVVALTQDCWSWCRTEHSYL
jgi:hypothetical protein